MDQPPRLIPCNAPWYKDPVGTDDERGHPLDDLLRRFDTDALRQRMLQQVAHVVRLFGRGKGGIHLEEMDALFPILDIGLRLVGLRRRAGQNVLQHRVTQNLFHLPGLPAAFTGLRVLHLSDLHVDLQQGDEDAFTRSLTRLLQRLDFDLCVITGDFRYETAGPYGAVTTQMAVLAPALQCRFGAFGVLGNHDFIEQVPYLERLGIRMLVNEAAAIEQDGERLWLVGVDDPHFYGTHDLERATAALPAGACWVGLVHSPELFEEAAGQGAALYLCGHTHGGQLCLPGGIPLYLDAQCPRRLARGRWSYEKMLGYTSSGTGASGLPVRLNCPPEVAIHVLRPQRVY
jgi:predicted MPP superfamily phosphohydrolase